MHADLNKTYIIIYKTYKKYIYNSYVRLYQTDKTHHPLSSVWPFVLQRMNHVRIQPIHHSLHTDLSAKHSQ